YVTVDTSSKYNQVFWDKTELDTLAIDSFRIYRKTTSLFVYIGCVSVHTHTSFTDSTSTPAFASDFYKISLLDTCGQESQLSTYHQTILLQANVGIGNVVNLS